MKAFIVDRYKSNSALRLGEMPEPDVRDHDVLVAIHAASLNQLDAKIRDGEFKLILPYRLPLILGNDMAGVVVRVEPKVQSFKSGDVVYARPNQDRIGTFAELIAMNEADVALKPKNLAMEEAASHPPGGPDSEGPRHYLRQRGIVASEGRTPTSVEAMALDARPITA